MTQVLVSCSSVVVFALVPVVAIANKPCSVSFAVQTELVEWLKIVVVTL